MSIIKLDAKTLQNAKPYAIFLLSVILIGFINLSLANSMLINQAIIRSTGRIGVTKANIVYNSEIRGVFGYEDIYGYAHDWNVIAQTLKQYGINAFFMNDLNAFGARPDAEIKAAIAACHANGIEYHSVMAVLCDAKNEATAAIRSDGTVWSIYVQCPIRAHDIIIETVKWYVSTYDVDGLMLDFIRYDSVDMCYCPQCKAAFEEWLGEGMITDWTPFFPDQSRWLEYAEWRNIPVTKVVKDIHDAVKAIKPNLLISEAAWTYFQDCPIYWRKYLGQDTGKWIKEDYIDFVAPMMYTSNLAEVQEFIRDDQKYMTGGAEGKIPLLCFLDCSRGATPAEIKAEIDYARSVGIDGWILWRYGGPGTDVPFPDVRNFLSILSLPQTFSLDNIAALPSQTNATISWITELPATSKVEYSTSPLFNATWQQWRDDIYYWWIVHVEGIIAENSTSTTDHSITLTGLSPETKYYFRVQSQDPSGTATSKVLTFTTES
jgi:hypothetical protein